MRPVLEPGPKDIAVWPQRQQGLSVGTIGALRVGELCPVQFEAVEATVEDRAANMLRHFGSV